MDVLEEIDSNLDTVIALLSDVQALAEAGEREYNNIEDALALITKYQKKIKLDMLVNYDIID